MPRRRARAPVNAREVRDRSEPEPERQRKNGSVTEPDVTQLEVEQEDRTYQISLFGVEIHLGMYLNAILILGFGVAIYLCASLVRNIVREPYLDEIFHIPQTQSYCTGNLTHWDPKITTFPGLYLWAAGVCQLLGIFGVPIMDFCCHMDNLRNFNVLFGILNIMLLHIIVRYYMVIEGEERGEMDWRVILQCVNISSLPIYFFFFFLYYTDVISMFFLLAMHFLHCAENHPGAAFMGVFSVAMRQTNVIWVFFHGLIVGLRALEHWWECCKKVEFTPKNFETIAYRLLRSMLIHLEDLVPYVTVCLLFGAFVIWNGGIVLGDKEAHQLTLNVPQLCYLAGFLGVSMAPAFLLRIRSTLRFLRAYWRYFLALGAFFTLAVHFNTVAHPYLLADNRHYTFYVWRWIYQSNRCLRYLLVPAYVIVWAFLLDNVSKGVEGHLASTALVICAVLQFVPTLLLEFRYFIPFYFFARLRFRRMTDLELVLEACLNGVVNATTFYLFLFRTFKWEDSEEMQRFMW